MIDNTRKPKNVSNRETVKGDFLKRILEYYHQSVNEKHASCVNMFSVAELVGEAKQDWRQTENKAEWFLRWFGEDKW
jgi:hypothetical protein